MQRRERGMLVGNQLPTCCMQDRSCLETSGDPHCRYRLREGKNGVTSQHRLLSISRRLPHDRRQLNHGDRSDTVDDLTKAPHGYWAFIPSRNSSAVCGSFTPLSVCNQLRTRVLLTAGLRFPESFLGCLNCFVLAIAGGDFKSPDTIDRSA